MIFVDNFEKNIALGKHLQIFWLKKLKDKDEKILISLL